MATTPPLALVTITHYYPRHGGGIEIVADRLAREFAARDVAITWFASDTDQPPEVPPGVLLSPIGTWNFVERMTQLPYPLWSLRVLPALWRAISRADAVHVHEHLYMGSILGVILARLRGRPVVVTQHIGALVPGSRCLALLFTGVSRTLGAFVFALANRIVFISDNVRAFFGRSASARGCLIFNGIDGERFHHVSDAARAAARQRFGWPAGRPVALFVGRFVRKKGLDVLEQLSARFPDVQWAFAGSGPVDPAAWGRQNVAVLGRVPQERLPELYGAADLLVLPSHGGEGFPLVVQEALACGLAVLSTSEVATACPEATAMIRHPGSDHRCEPARETIEGWARALRNVLDDRAWLHEREQRASRAHALWSWTVCAERYLALFRELKMETAG
jgi:glycosyltransferase involved in cell wall biosynthesis